jgi:hypothetical protein
MLLTTKQVAELDNISERRVRAIIKHYIKLKPKLAQKSGRDWLINEKEYKKIRGIS